LPRSGSSSVAAALELLGYKVLHSCPLTHNETSCQIQDAIYDKKWEVIVSSELLHLAPKLKSEFSWILLSRAQASWKNSITDFPVAWENGQFTDLAKRWLNDWNWILNNINGMHFQVKDGWEPLCQFLGKTVPEVEFPWLNKSPDNWSI